MPEKIMAENFSMTEVDSKPKENEAAEEKFLVECNKKLFSLSPG
jgi:hypothetical protein